MKPVFLQALQLLLCDAALEKLPVPFGTEGRKRVVGIIARYLVARDLKSENELMGYNAISRTEALIGNAIRIAKRILTKIDRMEE